MNKKSFKMIKKNWELYLVFLLPLIYLITFKYIPMFGLQIAFKNYSFADGILGSEWVGFKHFARFLNSYDFSTIFLNTLGLSIYQLIAGFPLPIILAIALNYCKNQRYKKVVQMVTYAPHFISVVIMVGLTIQFLDGRSGFVNIIMMKLGHEPVNFMGDPGYFKSIYVWSGIWQTTGWNSIIYLASLASIPPSLHEAAIMDGASKLQRIWHIDIKGIMPTIIILLILNLGRIMQVGFEKVLLLQNPLNISSSEIISTYVYKVGLASAIPDFSYATTIGLFTSIINLILICTVNRISKKLSDTSLW